MSFRQSIRKYKLNAILSGASFLGFALILQAALVG